MRGGTHRWGKIYLGASQDGRIEKVVMHIIKTGWLK